MRKFSRSERVIASKWLLLCIALILALARCGSGPGTSPSSILTPATGLEFSATSHDFGNVPLNSNSVWPLTLSNTGTAAVKITNVNVTGSEFTITGVTPPVTVAAGGNISFSVVFTPTKSARVTESISVASDTTNLPPPFSVAGSAHFVTLQWSPPASLSGIQGYDIFRGTTPGGEDLFHPINVGVIPSSVTAFTDTNVMGGATYYYVMTSVSATGVQSVNSNEVCTSNLVLRACGPVPSP